MTVGGFCADNAEGIAAEKPRAIHRFGEGKAQFGVGDDHVGGFETGQVEGFAGRGTDDAVLGEFFADAGKGGEGMAGMNQVAVNFVGNDKHVVGEADFTETGQFFACPDTTNRVVGTAQDCHFDGGIGRFFG